MAVGTKKLKILHCVILMVSIKMMDLKHQLLPIPVTYSTNLAMCITL